MSAQTRTYGATNFSYFNQNDNANITSQMVINDTGSNVSGAFISGAFTSLRPIMFVSLQITWYDSSGTVRYKISSTKSGSDLWTSSNISTTTGSLGTLSPTASGINLAAFTTSTRHYGFRKQDTGTTRVRRADTANQMYVSNPEADRNGPIRATVVWHTAPNAPTKFTSTSKTSTSVSLSWAKPTDMGGPTSLTGYRILYRASTSSTWLSTGKFGSNTTTTATVSGLEPETQYDFFVAATNSVTDEHNSSYTSVASHTGLNSDLLKVGTNQAIPTAPTLTFTRSNLVFSYSGSSTVDYGSISSYEVSQRTSSDGGTTFGAWSVISAALPGTTYSSSFTGIPARSYQVRVRAKSNLNVFGPYTESSILHAPNVPLIPINPIVLTKNVKRVNIDWDAFRTNANAVTAYNGATITGYEIQFRYSEDKGATWTIFAELAPTGTINATTTVFLTENLLVAKTYQFRVLATSNVGNSAYQTSPEIFVSAYGSRATGPTSFVPIENAKIFLGIGQSGADASGWKIIENVRRFNGTAWTDLET